MKLSKEMLKKKIEELDQQESRLLAELNRTVGIRDAYVELLEMENIPDTAENAPPEAHFQQPENEQYNKDPKGE